MNGTTENQDVLAVRYEYDPTTGAVDQTGYWALIEENSSACEITPPTPTPTTGLNPLLLFAIPLAMIGIAGITEKKGGQR